MALRLVCCAGAGVGAILLARRVLRARRAAAALECVDEPDAAPPNGPAPHAVRSLHVFPVKSCAGVAVESLDLDAWGIVGDRRFMVYRPGATPRFVTQRQLAKMALVEACVRSAEDGGGLLLSLRSRIPHGPRHAWGLSPFAPRARLDVRIDLRIAHSLPAVRVGIWDDTVDARDVGDDAARWLSAQLREAVRLCWAAPDFQRPVDARYTPAYALRAGGTLPQVAFGDGYPLLLASTASLRRLNVAIVAAGGAAVPMSRFRANVVVSCEQPFEEDRWKRVRIGDVEFAVVKGCSRCKIPTIDQRTAAVAPGPGGRGLGEPHVTLRKFRKRGDDVYFGQNLVPLATSGTIRHGDSVVVLERGEPTWDCHAVPAE
ncbi:hypothetical protein KFE25_010212 [Diacronema lutheri]|uniref:MOSC domain-containing protein n=2 Tax=Diacronema lutheri TaxID=2081491 RepID=A0A8J6C9R7_DIALT|nr:hypothetical protein KFE25_010212 [Diacronema lutheri]